MENIEMPPLEEQEVVEQQPVEQVQQAPQEQAASKQDLVQENWRLYREKTQQIERERDEALRRIKKYEELLEKRTAPTQQEDEDVSLNPDDIPEWKHVDKRYKKLENKIKAQEERAAVESAESKRKLDETIAESKIKSNFPDYFSVVTNQSIEALNIAYPEIAQSIKSTSDLYTQAAAAYNIIKNMGLSGETYARDKEIAQRNSVKPRPLASVSAQEGANGPLSHANAFSNGLTSDLKKQLYQEMQEIRKRS